MDSLINFGKPVNILTFSNTKVAVINFSDLENVFSHPDIQDRKVVVLSLIGALRGGKSYLLDYCLRFLYAHVSE